MAIKFNRSQTFATGGTVTSAALHNLIDGTDIYPALITDQSNLATISTADKLLIADTDDAINAKSTTVQNLFDQAFSGGTYTALNLSGALTYGTATGNRTVSTNASITTGTINNATLGTTTGTAATFTNATATGANITNGTIQTLTSSTASITGGTFSGLLNSSTGTFSGSINSTLGTVGTLNSTTGTITNLSTTLAGDFTISGGTGTLGTTGVTAGTYGTNTAAVTLTLDNKGRVTTVSTSAIQTTPADGSITYAKLSTSATEADNVDKRVAKAWVNFNGTGAVAIRDSFNVSSITDNGTGNYTINFSVSMPNANYAVVACAKRNDASSFTLDPNVASLSSGTYSSVVATGFCRIVCKATASSPEDPDAAIVTVFSS